jgi:ribosomal protein S13
MLEERAGTRRNRRLAMLESEEMAGLRRASIHASRACAGDVRDAEPQQLNESQHLHCKRSVRMQRGLNTKTITRNEYEPGQQALLS